MGLINLKRDKKGNLGNQMLLLLVMAIVVGLIMLVIFIGQLVLPPLVSTTTDTNTILSDAFASSGDTNLIAAGDASFAPASRALNNLEWVSYTMMILMFLVFLIMCFYVRTYPFLLFVWIIIIVVLLFLALYLTVVYQDLAADPTLGGYYTSWENSDYVLRNLPVFILVAGIIGGIIMFMLSSREQEAEIGGQYL